jgi:RNA polymerase sigma-70 factor (ECF subfamily)
LASSEATRKVGTRETRERSRAQWMAQAQRGDAEAYRALLNDIGPEVMGFLRSRVRNPQEAEDLYQEIFLGLHRARRTYQPPRPVEPWLFAIARHVVARHVRRYRLRTGREVLVESPPEGCMEDSGPARVRLAQALDRLPPTHREAIELLKLEGLSTRAAAARAATTPGALRVRAHRAYKALRRLLRS